MKNHDIIEVEGTIRRETELGLLLEANGMREWVSKSLVEDNEDGTFSMPEWLAEEKGFI